MSIWVTGDIHGDTLDLDEDYGFSQSKDMTNQEENYLIICGDFGLVWDYQGENSTEKKQLDWLEKRPYTTLFVDGNHENHIRLNNYPVSEWHGGKVHFIRPHVIHLMRGQVFNINGKSFFTFGGASSHDIQDGIIDPNDFSGEDDLRREIKDWWLAGKMFRIKNRSWWERELPSAEEMEDGVNNLKAVNNKVNYIISHCASSSTAALMSYGLYKPDKLTDYFQKIEEYVDFKRHYFGHYHVDMMVNEKQQCLFNDFIKID